MPDIEFDCPHCRQSLIVDELRMKGRNLKCPACSGDIQLEIEQIEQTEEEEEEEEEDVGPAFAPEPEPRRSYCTACGARLDTGARFCGACGTRVGG